MTAATMPSAVGQIAINIKDLGRAVAFYRDVVGLEMLFEVPPTMAFFGCGGVRLMLSAPSEERYDHPSSVIYFRVDDLQGAYDGMVSHGAKFLEPPHLIARMPDHELWMAFFEDTEGNINALMSERR